MKLTEAWPALAATSFGLAPAGPGLRRPNAQPAVGADELLRQVRADEAVDPEGRQWPRTKRSDDATAVYLALDQGANF